MAKLQTPKWREEWTRLVGDHKYLVIRNWDEYQVLTPSGFPARWIKDYVNADFDTWVGLDQGQHVLSSAQLAFGAPVAISSYIANTGDGSSWGERLTSTKKEFAVAVQLDAALNDGSATAGTSGQVLTSTSTKTAWATNAPLWNNLQGASGNLTLVDSNVSLTRATPHQRPAASANGNYSNPITAGTKGRLNFSTCGAVQETSRHMHSCRRPCCAVPMLEKGRDQPGAEVHQAPDCPNVRTWDPEKGSTWFHSTVRSPAPDVPRWSRFPPPRPKSEKWPRPPAGSCCCRAFDHRSGKRCPRRAIKVDGRLPHRPNIVRGRRRRRKKFAVEVLIRGWNHLKSRACARLSLCRRALKQGNSQSEKHYRAKCTFHNSTSIVPS